ncbi:hydrolase 2, exosortase A system-associated [Massilia sp. 9096]|uniref:hydrolase 2, exosortase A system-associated n=1 Tax=Massilia sp. 9096 TaxID=1500894 RepID=UPI0009DCC60B|nr:hydrolase 2, exosortase A system-associated [Massilia sp. 9096]
MTSSIASCAENFFLPATAGQRYCMYHPAAGLPKAALLYVAPFGEEMNRTRRAAALQARALALQGVAVLQIDLYGSGDSDGEFRDASWQTWKQDLALAHAWLAAKTGRAVGLWGIRLGALLALDYAASAALPVARFVFWQPVLRGAVYLNQLLRLRLAGEMLAGGAAVDSRQLRAALREQAQEIGGYDISPAMADAIESLDAGKLAAPDAPVHWFEVVADAERPAPPPALQLADSWRARGVQVALQAVPDQPCWATQEIAECPQLRAATTAAIIGAIEAAASKAAATAEARNA